MLKPPTHHRTRTLVGAHLNLQVRLSPELLIMASFAEPDFLRVMAHFFDRWTRFIDTNVPRGLP